MGITPTGTELRCLDPKYPLPSEDVGTLWEHWVTVLEMLGTQEGRASWLALRWD